MVSPNKVTCPNCKAKFKIDKLAVHLKYFCGEGAERTEAQARQRRGFARRGGGKTTKKQQTKAKTKTITKTKAKTAPVKRKRNATKQKVTAKKVAGYDTDSSLSVDAAVVTPPGSRAKRAAAASANKKLKTTYKELENDEESSGWSKSSVDDDSSEEETASESEAEISSSSEASEPKTRKKARVSPSSHDSDSSDSLDESESQESNPKKRKNPRFSPRFQKKKDNEALARAKQKQAEALAAAKKNKKPKKAPMTKASNKKTKPKLKRISKKFDSDGSSSGSSSSDEESARDPMEGIDMKKLTKEAMKGCRFSILHAFSWFRIGRWYLDYYQQPKNRLQLSHHRSLFKFDSARRSAFYQESIEPNSPCGLCADIDSSLVSVWNSVGTFHWVVMNRVSTFFVPSHVYFSKIAWESSIR